MNVGTSSKRNNKNIKFNKSDKGEEIVERRSPEGTQHISRKTLAHVVRVIYRKSFICEILKG